MAVCSPSLSFPLPSCRDSVNVHNPTELGHCIKFICVETALSFHVDWHGQIVPQFFGISLLYNEDNFGAVETIQKLSGASSSQNYVTDFCTFYDEYF